MESPHNQELIEDIERQAQAYWDFMNQEEREQYAWLAGIIDGEGTVGIHKRRKQGRVYYCLRLSVGMVNEATISYMHMLTEKCGSITKHRPKNPKHSPSYHWRIEGANAASILRCCLPFLHTKKYHALLGIEYTDMQSLEGKGGMGKILTRSQIARREEIYQKFKELNKRGPR